MSKSKVKRVEVVYLCPSCGIYDLTHYYKGSRQRDGHPHCVQCGGGDLDFMELHAPTGLREVGLRAALELIHALHCVTVQREVEREDAFSGIMDTVTVDDRTKLAFLVSRLCELRDIVKYDSTNWSER